MDVVLLGAGNLATNLAFALNEKGYSLKQVYSRTEESAKTLARALDTDFTNEIDEIDPGADLYFVSLKDDVIKDVLSRITFQPPLIVHTAGSVSIRVFDSFFENYGVFYPLQTFSKNRRTDFRNIPLCLEANSDENLKTLEKIAKDLSNEVHILSSEQRLHLHVAAVFACNFTNFMFVGAEKILRKNDIPFHILLPLIQETVDKIYQNSPLESQTGPAVRKDKQTMDRHLKLLSDSGLFQNLYRFVSDEIINYYQNNMECND